MIKFRPAATADIEMIRQLAYDIWPAAYSTILSKDQLKYMLELIYSRSALLDQMIGKGHSFLLCFDDERAVGFASVSPKNEVDPSIFRLHKLYLLPGLQGKGVGKQFLQYITDLTRQNGGRQLELNVNRHNPAFHFYTSQGFYVTREEDIDIGNGYFMNDYVMLLDLTY